MITAATDPVMLAKLRLHKAKLESELATANFEIEFKKCAGAGDNHDNDKPSE